MTARLAPGAARHHRRSRPPPAGRVEPAVERREVHSARRTRARSSCGLPVLDAELDRPRQRLRDRPGVPALHLRAVPPGGRLVLTSLRGTGARPRHRTPPRRTARRHSGRRERRAGPRCDVHGPAPLVRATGQSGRAPAASGVRSSPRLTCSLRVGSRLTAQGLAQSSSTKRACVTRAHARLPPSPRSAGRRSCRGARRSASGSRSIARRFPSPPCAPARSVARSAHEL